MNSSHTGRSLIGVALVLAATALTASAQSIMVSTQSVTPCCVGDAIGSGDFNNDGTLDIITTSGVYLGRGDGTFAPPVSPNVGVGASDVVIGDFNGDGKLDVAFVDGSIQILLGNGDGTFRVGQNIRLDGAPLSLTTSDFNHDEKLDLAVAVSAGTPDIPRDEVVILEGDGTGHFSAVNTLSLTASIDPFLVKVRVGDFNYDGQVDLAVLQQQALSVWFGNGNFTFDQVMLNHYAEADDMSTGDLNQDGFTDILVGFAIPENPPGPSHSPRSAVRFLSKPAWMPILANHLAASGFSV